MVCSAQIKIKKGGNLSVKFNRRHFIAAGTAAAAMPYLARGTSAQGTWPSRTIRHVWRFDPPQAVTLVSNADGFRGRDLHVRDERPRIVVLGDSMTFGVGVEAPARELRRSSTAADIVARRRRA